MQRRLACGLKAALQSHRCGGRPLSLLCPTLLRLPCRRRFLRFVTGCPRLPPGGLAALQPRLTVVRKLTTAGRLLLLLMLPGPALQS
jgi:hypothetical protein